ncbi:PKD domain-containing protein [Hymenobacter terrestris]|uniref:PKD domain-containing protein n=1 Tax=Hymenobacter terrestris TaxID=2748310 RepID=A0ABX2Q4M3_9BACT|nr:PKD domain-containing protein [Hymenobacter terrestris]NVO84961.1 PKD domain-containing protein [Hymenobacter terrestris]
MNTSFTRLSAALLISGLWLTSCSKKPDACFTIEKGIPSSKVNDEVEVNAGCASDADSFVWEWGDGASDTGIKAKHKYNVAGNFTIKLTAKGDGKSASTSKPVTIVQ